MQLSKLKINNFRCFGPETTVINFQELTTFIGSNSSGKTAAMIALLRLFGTLPSERDIIRSDFHLPTDKPSENLEASSLYIEAVFSFPELNDPNQPDAAIPSFFKYFVVEREGEAPYLRVMLESTYTNDGSIEGMIDTNCYFVLAAESEEITDGAKIVASRQNLHSIRCIYVPAIRNPANQLRNVAGTLLNRLLCNIKMDSKTKETLENNIAEINKTVQEMPDISAINTILQSQWTSFHDDERYGNTKISVDTSDVDSLLKHTQVKFAPTEVPRDYDVSELGDGLRSLFYFSLVNTLLEIETKLLRDLGQKPAEADGKLMLPPVLTFIVVEEPENHIAPQLLGKVILNLKKTATLSNAQAILSSHSASIIKRVDATCIRYFRINTSSKANVKSILLPEKEDTMYKFIKGAVEAYPEIYFANKVVLGEGDSEKIVIPYMLEKAFDNADVMGITVAPLGGRHVNYFWKLLVDLEIPFITLLDLDKERCGGGWGRIKYAIQQLNEIGADCTNLLIKKDGTVVPKADLEQMHEWDDKDSAELDFWIKKLEDYSIYFSEPLDLDFLLLEKFPEAYKGIVDENSGPRIKKVGKIIEIENAGEFSPEYSKRINADVRATLKEEGGDGDTYSVDRKKLMVWYKYLFLGRGKPSTHLAALPNCEINNINDVPGALKKLIIKAVNGAESNE